MADRYPLIEYGISEKIADAVRSYRCVDFV
jgi:hypothetical protein